MAKNMTVGVMGLPLMGPGKQLPGGGSFGLTDTVEPFRFALEEAVEQGRIHQPVEVVSLRDDKPPPPAAYFGRPMEVAKEWKQLADMGVLAILGPGHGDLCMALRPTVEQGKVPTISYNGAELWPGEYCYQVPFGRQSEKSSMLAQWLKKQGIKTVAVTRERVNIADEYVQFLRLACERAGIHIVADIVMPSPVTPAWSLEQCKRDLQIAKNTRAEGWVHLGNYVAPELNPALKAIDWDPPRICPSSYTQVWGDPKWLHALEGWVGIDLFDETNPQTQAFLDRYEKRHRVRPAHVFATLVYDMGRMIAEGIALAPILSPEGVKQGLDQVKMIPAASGGPGTYMCFSQWDHIATKGNSIVYRGVRNGRNTLLGYYEL